MHRRDRPIGLWVLPQNADGFPPHNSTACLNALANLTARSLLYMRKRSPLAYFVSLSVVPGSRRKLISPGPGLVGACYRDMIYKVRLLNGLD